MLKPQTAKDVMALMGDERFTRTLQYWRSVYDMMVQKILQPGTDGYEREVLVDVADTFKREVVDIHIHAQKAVEKE